MFKAALFNVFILEIDQVTVWRGITPSVKTPQKVITQFCSKAIVLATVIYLQCSYPAVTQQHYHSFCWILSLDSSKGPHQQR